MFLRHPSYIRDKAREMRVERDLTIDEIAERLAISRQTIAYWVRDLPLRRPRRHPNYEQRAIENSARYKRLRDEAYARGWQEFDELARDPTFRDFVCMYIGEGYKRDRNRVSIGNSDSRVILVAARWVRRLAGRPVTYWVQYHADQPLAELSAYWSELLGVDPTEIRLQRKSNSNQLNGRTWRSPHGVLTVCSNDTYLRARLEAWMDRVRQEWLDSAA